MQSRQNILRSLGEQAPILLGGMRQPDRREVSLRWLAGTVLVGVSGSTLMGIALMTAVQGSHFPRSGKHAPVLLSAVADGQSALRGKRVVPPRIQTVRRNVNVIDVATVTRKGDADVVAHQPYAITRLPLAAQYAESFEYPPYDPATLYAAPESGDAEPESQTFYSADVDSSIKIVVKDFPATRSGAAMDQNPGLDEVEESVRLNGAILTADMPKTTPIAYVDPERFQGKSDLDLSLGIPARVITENSTTAQSSPIAPTSADYRDDIIPISVKEDAAIILQQAGYRGKEAESARLALADNLKDSLLQPGDLLRLGILRDRDTTSIKEISVYRRDIREFTVARRDDGRFVPAPAPETALNVAAAGDDPGEASDSDDGGSGTVYDGIYRSALANGIRSDTIDAIIRALPRSVDLGSPVRRSDTLMVFSSVQANASAPVTLAFLGAHIGNQALRLYNFQPGGGRASQFYDEKGESARQLLLRSPVSHFRVSSAFGMRRHPILGFKTMHNGVDLAAPKGTAIVASGDGTVIKAGATSGGYGNQTIIQHANGYTTSYNHQSAIAKNIRAGVEVRQGQVIGWVGSTGRSTGPHVHYEVAINGNRVDPMSVRLPKADALHGKPLAEFMQRKDRIDDLVSQPDAGEDGVDVSSTKSEDWQLRAQEQSAAVQ